MADINGTVTDESPSAMDNINLNKGIVDGTNTHAMTLAFGGIQGAKRANTTASFFNIGSWGTSNAASNNSNYTDLDNFVGNFSAGVRFRWKQDPTQTVYTIGGDISSNGHTRHSSFYYKDDENRGYINVQNPYPNASSGRSSNCWSWCYIHGGVIIF
jgi:hypothetical protein